MLDIVFNQRIPNPVNLTSSLSSRYVDKTGVFLDKSKNSVLEINSSVLSDPFYGSPSYRPDKTTAAIYDEVKGYFEHNIKLLTEFFKEYNGGFKAYFHRKGKTPIDSVEVVKV
ncbi:hypothetical protein J4205_03665 [Candidatus Pacearchaeota archaeon]|nr:hypothetical protein [Candidatus Pacearchaeota archaeon]